MKRDIIFNVLINLLLLPTNAMADGVLFPDEDTEDQCSISCTEDSLGRVEDTDGTKWKQGADGTYRSEDGKECRWSKALGEWVCGK